MSLIKKTDEEIIKIATPLWDELVKASNMRVIVVLLKIFQLKCFTALMKLKLENNGQATSF